jgi:alkaline phosphatase
MGISRRSVLGAGATALGASLLSFPANAAKPQKLKKRPKNIIFCVVDGMATQTMAMADQFQRIHLGHPSYWATLLGQDDVTTGWQITSSLNSLVTDSSAGSSSWGSGRHIWNGQTNEFPDGTKLRTINSLMREAGVRTGLVTTTTMTHATPSGFAINIWNRDLEAKIAELYLDADIDVLLGGGNRYFDGSKRSDKRDMYAAFKAKGYDIARSKAELEASKGKKVLGIFSESHTPFSVDRIADSSLNAVTPSLADCVGAALERLKGSPKGFLLQIEAGKVDHGGHANDLAALLYDQMAGEEAFRVAIEFARQDKDTLVVITADHATGGPSLNGAGAEYIDSTAGLQTLAGMKASYEVIRKALGTGFDSTKVKDVTNEWLGIELTSEEANAVVDASKNASPFKVSDFLKSWNGTYATVLGNHSKVLWTSQNHTSEHVMVTAVGPGSEWFRGLTTNIEMFDFLIGTKGLKWSNPTMDFETARRHYATLEERHKADKEETFAMHDHDGYHSDGCLEEIFG